MERLLWGIAERGWTQDAREEFVRRYDRLIGRAIVYFLARYRGLDAHEICRLLESVERRLKGPTPESPLLDLVEETYLQVYKQVFRGRLVQGYVDGYQQGWIECEFPAYLRGVVRNRVVDCLRASEPRFQEVSVEEWQEQIAEDDPDWAKGLRAEWWDRLICCRESQPQELEELRSAALALEEEAARHTRLCLVCAQLKAEEAETVKEDLRMFLVYYLSNYGTKAPLAEKKLPKLQELSLERIRGLRLSWAEVFQIFGRECNPSRVRAKIREKFEEL